MVCGLKMIAVGRYKAQLVAISDEFISFGTGNFWRRNSEVSDPNREFADPDQSKRSVDVPFVTISTP